MVIRLGFGRNRGNKSHLWGGGELQLIEEECRSRGISRVKDFLGDKGTNDYHLSWAPRT